MATSFHNISNIFVCPQCRKYHVCDGYGECLPVNMGDGLVCVLTGRCVAENISFQHIAFAQPPMLQGAKLMYEDQSFEAIIGNVQEDVLAYFEKSAHSEIKDQILDGPGKLKQEVLDLIKKTFSYCYYIFSSVSYAYSLVCSIYIHVIISVYSSKTVYGNLIFKCTKNKKFDAVVKSIRQTWMSTLTTGDTASIAAT